MYVYFSGKSVVASTMKPDCEYLYVDKLPDGEGCLRTDLKNVWWEPIFENKEDIFISADKKVEAQQERMDFLEDCIAEMAMQVYS